MGIKIVNNSPFNMRIRVGMGVVSIPRHTVWTCPLGKEQSIDARTIDKRHLQVVNVSDEEVEATLKGTAGATEDRDAEIAAEAAELQEAVGEKPAAKGSSSSKAKGKGSDSDWPS